MKNERTFALLLIILLELVQIAIIVGALIILTSEVSTQELEYNTKLYQLRDSIALEKEFHYNTFWYADSLRVVIQNLPDSASYIMLENELKTLSSSLNRESDINLALVRKIQSLTKINTILNQKTNENPKDILKNLLDKKD